MACVCVAGQTRAEFQPAFDFSNPRVTLTTTAGSAAFGYSFTTGTSPVILDALGLLVLTHTPSAPPGTTVRIYQNGTMTNLASVSISTSDPTFTSLLGNTYAYKAISPLTLMANTTYDIVFDSVVNNGANASLTTVSNSPTMVTIGSGRFGPPFPTSDLIGLGPYFGPTFEIATTVPEPASMTLFGIGAVGVLSYAWRKRLTA
jgi:hypothetical protein